ncbi:hypothetical protein OHA33_44835 [Streptomyces sp. NBC_00562]|nr:hypothetical protein [Streptomyces sp. NBC_00562]WUC17424.1 hypothetical protein OHA33_00015 [Streptomyces sp. NBC_00562]WUC25243.1 hypothetical protein OHA33_44835 [Streptomyces sp. NBC_00562]
MPARAPQRNALDQRSGLGSLSAQHRVKKIDRGGVGEIGGGRVGQLLRRLEDVQRRADPVAGPVQQSQPRLSLVALGDIHDRRGHSQRPPSGVIQPVPGDRRSDLGVRLVGRAQRRQDIAPGPAGFQHLARQGFDALGLLLFQTEGAQHFRQRAAEELLDREGPDVPRSGVEVHETQPGIQNVQADRGLGEQRSQNRITHVTTGTTRNIPRSAHGNPSRCR